MSVKELNVVNGCQSLSTIFNCSESVRNVSDAYIMFRFYEISNAERADEISTCTNSQSAVKARDLRSNGVLGAVGTVGSVALFIVTKGKHGGGGNKA